MRWEGWVQFKRIDHYSLVSPTRDEGGWGGWCDDDATVEAAVGFLDPWHSLLLTPVSALECSNRLRINPYRTRFHRNPTSRSINSCHLDRWSRLVLVLVLVLLVSPAVFSYPLSNDADPVWHWVWSGWVFSQNVRIKINYTTAEATSSKSVARNGTGQNGRTWNWCDKKSNPSPTDSVVLTRQDWTGLNGNGNGKGYAMVSIYGESEYRGHWGTGDSRAALIIGPWFAIVYRNFIRPYLFVSSSVIKLRIFPRPHKKINAKTMSKGKSRDCRDYNTRTARAAQSKGRRRWPELGSTN